MDSDHSPRREPTPELSDHESISGCEGAVTPALISDVIDFAPHRSRLDSQQARVEVTNKDNTSTKSSRTSSVAFSVISEDAEIPWDYKSFVRYTDGDFATPRSKRLRSSAGGNSHRHASSASTTQSQGRQVSTTTASTFEEDTLQVMKPDVTTPPIVLLQCGISLLPMPFSATTFPKLLPGYPELYARARRLNEKVTPIVLDRGILLPHPGRDFGLLEETLLEHLDLEDVSPGSCTRYSAPAERLEYVSEPPNPKDDSSAIDENCSECCDDEAPGCETCGGRLESAAGQNSKFWDIRIYAANGLLRKSAWQAAWREMEVVDVEIGPRWPKEAREMLERDEELFRATVVEKEKTVEHAKVHDLGTATLPNTQSASTTQNGTTQPRSSSKVSNKRKPLSELLQDYLLRQVRGRSYWTSGLLLLVVVLLWSTMTRTNSSSTYSSISDTVPRNAHERLELLNTSPAEGKTEHLKLSSGSVYQLLKNDSGAGLLIVLPSEKIDALLKLVLFDSGTLTGVVETDADLEPEIEVGGVSSMLQAGEKLDVDVVAEGPDQVKDVEL